jgi:hypothetical protein
MKASFLAVLYLIAISPFLSVQSLGADKTEIVSAEIQQKQMPLIIGQSVDDLFNIFLHINALENDPLVLDAVQIDFDSGCQFSGLSSLVIKNTVPSLDNRQSSEFGSSTHFSDEIIIRGNYQLKSGLHFLKFDFILRQDP